MFRAEYERLVRRVWPSLAEAHGISSSELAGSPSNLPRVLREFYEVAGRHPEIMGAHERLRGPSELYIIGKFVVFAEQNQRVFSVGIRTEDLPADDPSTWQYNPDEERWYPETQHLSTYLEASLCWQAVNSLESSGRARCTFSQFERLSPRVEVIGQRETYDTKAFVGDGVAGCYYESSGVIYVGAARDEFLEELEAAGRLKLEWL